ncbi:MAG: tRNA uridine-5-carboxymethylaminomethyl(34) synthesis enzyme MnmG [Acidobacteriota bacterium]
METLAPVVVIGGGHAGVEAAMAAARLGADVVLLTLRADALVRLSCNPAIGGIGKAHLVREIDALGGVMGRAADIAGIHFRVLNRRRGPAVQGPRVQQDHEAYPRVVTELVRAEPRIEIVEGEARAFVVESGRIRGVETADGAILPASAVVLTTGTFLRGRLFVGDETVPGGRVGEAPAEGLSDHLRELGLRLGRFKTGTPPRLERDSIDFGRFERQPGDEPPEPLSFEHLDGGEFVPRMPQVPTHLAWTSPEVHRIVRDHLDRSPLYTGRIDAIGPRYCPSFEDKVVKFPDRDAHLLHLEPMGLDHPWIYVNGLSLSLPRDVQEELVHRIAGLETARIARHGYAVAYDFVVPTQLEATLETRAVRGLFLAGQICGTTGYEEAAGLGLVAGTNAARTAAGAEPWVPDRLESYLGVMVDDLTTRGVLEPYRMFTSRAEARLRLASETADRRLTPLGRALGLVSEEQERRCRERWARIGELVRGLGERGARRILRGEDPAAVAGDVLGRKGPGRRDLETAAALIRYRGYLEREEREIARLRRAEGVRIPDRFDFDGVPGLSHEVRQRLAEVRPRSIGQAARIPGMTPAAVGLLAALVAGGAAARPSG